MIQKLFLGSLACSHVVRANEEPFIRQHAHLQFHRQQSSIVVQNDL
jgi:hypothetical protein